MKKIKTSKIELTPEKKERPLMKRKINCTEVLLTYYRDLYKFHARNLIKKSGKSLLTNEDLDKEFTYQDRTFKIIGMTVTGTIFLEEMIENEKEIYWECTREFTQLMLNRFYIKYKKLRAGDEILKYEEALQYTSDQLTLPIKIKTNKVKLIINDTKDFHEKHK